MYKQLIYPLLLTFFSLQLSAFSNNDIKLVINKISNAYGGDELKLLKSIKIEDHSKNLWPGQNEVPDLPDFWTINEELVIDFKNQRKSLISWRLVRTITDFEKYIVSKDSGRVYDLAYQKYTDDDWYNYSNTGRSIERSSDTLVAKQILENKDHAKLIGEALYRGHAHYLISFPLFNQSEYQIYIQKSSGLISKMTKNHPKSGQLVYVFSNHTKKGNLSFARDMNYFVGGKPRKISTYRNIMLNPDMTFAFKEPEEFSPWGEVASTDKKNYTKVADDIYLIGAGRSRSIFIDCGEYFVASGGGKDIAKNFKSLQHIITTNKPLKYVILTHHHQEHLSMIEPALSLGATIITTPENLPIIKKTVNQNVTTDNFLFVDKELSLKQDQIRILNIATAHAAQNLVIYFPQSQTLYSQDHFGTIYNNGNARPFKDMKTFISKVNQRGLKVKSYIDGRSPRVLTSTELKNIIATYKKPVCPDEYQVCNNK